MADITIQLPFYAITASTSGSEFQTFTLKINHEDPDEHIPGYTNDDVADAIRDAIGNLAGVTSVTLTRFDQEPTVI